MEELAEYESMVDTIRQNTVSQSSRTVYLSSSSRLIMWLLQNKPDLVTDDFKDSFSEENPPTQKKIVAYLQHAPNNPHPIHFERISARDFVTWLVTLQTRNGDPSYSSYNSHRTAFFNLFRNYHQTMSPTLETELSNHFKGLKRRNVQQMNIGETPIKTGKEPLSFGLYRYLAMSLLKQESNDFVFGHLFIVLCWNLMCRSTNVLSIDFSHIQWVEDALCIYFTHTKTDQFGDRPKDPRHIYPNPDKPEICPVLSLGLFWLTFSIDPNCTKLFAGNNQYERFRKALGRIARLSEVAEYLETLGLEANDLGSHSMRKGSATFCSSGSTSCPPSSAIHLRAGWAMGGVQDTYIRYESAGDMYVGRTVSGLPQDRAEFASVGPYFLDSDVLNQSVELVFPSLPPTMREIGKHVLASIVYHHEFIMQTLPRSHPVKRSLIFRSEALLNSLKPLVVVSLPGDSSGRFATGVPPHITLLNRMMMISNEIHQILPAINTATENTAQRIIQELEDRAIGAGTVTRTGLEDLLRSTLDQVLADRGVQRNSEPELAADPNQFRPQVHMWNGGIHKLPRDYVLPSTTVEVAWQNWMLEDSVGGIPRLKRCMPSDFYDSNQRKRFSDYSFLMRDIERVAIEENIWRNDANPQQVNAMYSRWFEKSNIPLLTSRGRNRRRAQLKWTSVANMMRTISRQSSPTEQ